MTAGIFQESASAASLTQINVTFWSSKGKNSPPEGTFIPVTENNDCAGFFGRPFKRCDVGQGLTPKANIAPILAKLDTGSGKDAGWTVNEEIFSSNTRSTLIDGFTVQDASGKTGTRATGNSGKWSFDGSIPDLNTSGRNIPGITHWSSKSSTGFVLSWIVDRDDETTTQVCNLGNLADPNNYNRNCLNAALIVSSGNWSTPTSQGLSHISFYGKEIPEPSTAIPAIFLFGLAGLYGRKKSA
ncbi:MAG: hypothetical protein ACXITR_11280 [Cyanobacterium sp.]